LLKPIYVKIEEIYVPADRRKEIDLQKIEQVAEEIMAETEHQPIQVRKGKDRYVLVTGVNRFEAQKALGEKKISVLVVGTKLF
jgi:ParB-like chromosome segregation protein Spo0J